MYLSDTASLSGIKCITILFLLRHHILFVCSLHNLIHFFFCSSVWTRLVEMLAVKNTFTLSIPYKCSRANKASSFKFRISNCFLLHLLRKMITNFVSVLQFNNILKEKITIKIFSFKTKKLCNVCRLKNVFYHY